MLGMDPMSEGTRPSTKSAVVGRTEAELVEGQVISGRYRIVRRLDSGGMGTVYLAEHVTIQKPFALKVLFPELAGSRDLAARFLQEARLSSRIRHENVVNISDFGETEDGLVYFVMEYLEGANLDVLVRANGPLPWRRALAIMSQIAAALQAAHDRGIIHRDIKPANVIVGERLGRPDWVKVLDFGIAKVVDTNQDSEVITNRDVEVLGTPSYMAPEQGQGDLVDCRTDIYGCGCLLFHLLTGRPPFSGGGQFGVLMKQQLEPPPAPSSRLEEGALPPQVDALVLRALAKDPAGRWQTMQEFAAAIDAALDLPAGHGRPPAARTEGDITTATLAPPRPMRSEVSPAPTRRQMRRWRYAIAGGIVLLFILVATLLSRHPPRAPSSVKPSPAVTPPSSATLPTTAVAPTETPPAGAVAPTEKAPPMPRTRPTRTAKPTRNRKTVEPVFEPLADPALD